MDMTPSAQDLPESGAVNRFDRATAERKRRGYYTVSEAAKFLALRHITLPKEVVGQPFDRLRKDESLARALGFQDCAQVATAVKSDEERGVPLPASATALFFDRFVSGPVGTRWLRHYETEIVSHIKARRLRAIDYELWEAGTEYQGDPAAALFTFRLLVLATEINALEAAQGSTLPPLPTGIVDLHCSRDDEPDATVSGRESMDTDEPCEDRDGSSEESIKTVATPRVYWKILLFENIAAIDRANGGHANIMKVMAWLRDPTHNNGRILSPPYPDGITFAVTDGIVWVDDADRKKKLSKKIVSTAISDARTAARRPV